MATNKTDRSFKTLINKLTTDENKRSFEEFGADTINVNADEIWAEAPHYDDPTTAIATGRAELRTLFVLTEDVTVPNQQAYRADDSGRLGDWISDKYGPNYVAKLYDNNDNEIFPTDPSDWFFDYQTGILAFSGDTSAFAKPFKITGYRYVGPKGVSGGGGVSGGFTEEALAFDWDPTNGEDPTTPEIVSTQAEVDAVQASLAGNAFKTLAGIEQSLPERIAFDITVTIPDGTHALGLTDLGDWTFHSIDPSARITVQSTSITTQVAGTASYTAQSVTTDSFILGSSPGWGADTRQGDFVKITAGSKAGAYRAVMKSPDDLTYQIAGKRFVNATDTVEFHEPAVKLTTDSGDVVLIGFLETWRSRSSGGVSAFSTHFHFIGVEFVGTGGLEIRHASLELSECRVKAGQANMACYESFVLSADADRAVVIDGTNATFGLLSYLDADSFFRTFNSDGSTALIKSFYGLFASTQSSVFVFSVGLADLFTAFYLYYPSTLSLVTGGIVRAVNVGTMVVCANGGRFRSQRNAGPFTNFPNGDVADLNLGGEVFTWVEMETYRDLLGPSDTRAYEEVVV